MLSPHDEQYFFFLKYESRSLLKTIENKEEFVKFPNFSIETDFLAEKIHNVNGAESRFANLSESENQQIQSKI